MVTGPAGVGPDTRLNPAPCASSPGMTPVASAMPLLVTVSVTVPVSPAVRTDAETAEAARHAPGWTYRMTRQSKVAPPSRPATTTFPKPSMATANTWSVLFPGPL